MRCGGRGAGAADVLPPGERRLVLETWNDTAHRFPAETLIDLLDAAAARHPDAVAVVFEGQRLTYAELHTLAARLAQRLTAAGAGPEGIVALALPRSLDLIVALLAVLKSGAAYLPLDPEYPAARPAAVVEDARPVVILSTTAVAPSSRRRPAEAPPRPRPGCCWTRRPGHPPARSGGPSCKASSPSASPPRQQA